MLYARDFRRIGREALTNRWGVAVGTGLVASFFGATAGISYPNFQWNNSKDIQDMKDVLNSDFRDFALVILLGVIAYVMVWVLIGFFLGGAIKLGYVRFNKNVVDNTNPQFSDLFSRFDIFWKGFVMQFLMGLFTLLWSFLFLIPGIIAAFRYAMAPYILEENPHLTASEAIDMSKEMMRGNKWRLFCLDISFIGWAILTIFTCGIGTLWLTPYRNAAYVAFFYEVPGRYNNQGSPWGNQNQNNGWM